MSYAIVFSSKTGNTRLLADTLRASLPQNECTYFGAPAPEALEAETLYIGFWTDKGHADDTLTAFLQTLKGKRVFLFGTAGFGGSAEYFEQILAAVQKSLDESNTVIGTYMCQGKMPMTVRQQYEKMLQQPNHAPNLEMLIENFDKALAHPDAADLDQLRKKAASCFSSPEGLHSGEWVLSDLHLKHQVSIAEYTSNRHLFSWGNTKEVQHHA